MKTTEEVIRVTAPNIQTAVFKIRGTAPYVQARFTEKAKREMMRKMEEGQRGRSKRERQPRDFDADFRNAMHISADGWIGIPASAFRNAIISACRLVGFKMTIAKLAVFVDADGFDIVDGIPLVRLDAGDAERVEMAVRNATGGPDIRVRPMWRAWGCTLRIRYDADQFSAEDLANLLLRAGQQVGIGEGRPDSKSSAGLGWGTFTLE